MATTRNTGNLRRDDSLRAGRRSGRLSLNNRPRNAPSDQRRSGVFACQQTFVDAGRNRLMAVKSKPISRHPRQSWRRRAPARPILLSVQVFLTKQGQGERQSKEDSWRRRRRAGPSAPSSNQDNKTRGASPSPRHPKAPDANRSARSLAASGTQDSPAMS